MCCPMRFQKWHFGTMHFLLKLPYWTFATLPVRHGLPSFSLRPQNYIADYVKRVVTLSSGSLAFPLLGLTHARLFGFVALDDNLGSIQPIADFIHYCSLPACVFLSSVLGRLTDVEMIRCFLNACIICFNGRYTSSQC